MMVGIYVCVSLRLELGRTDKHGEIDDQTGVQSRFHGSQYQANDYETPVTPTYSRQCGGYAP